MYYSIKTAINFYLAMGLSGTLSERPIIGTLEAGYETGDWAIEAALTSSIQWNGFLIGLRYYPPVKIELGRPWAAIRGGAQQSLLGQKTFAAEVGIGSAIDIMPNLRWSPYLYAGYPGGLRPGAQIEFTFSGKDESSSNMLGPHPLAKAK